MRHRLRGFACALLSLIAVFFAAWLSELGSADWDIMAVMFLPFFAGAFSLVTLFVVVLPQTLFARFIVRRVNNHPAVPFMLFVGVSSVLIAPVARWHSAGNPLSTLAWGVGYLFAGCAVLWCISFRHETAA
jgi:hypothetical protein